MRVVTIVGALAACLAVQAQTPEMKTAGQVYKNVQELKDIPADQLQPAMQFIAASLGTECTFCHVQGNMASDEKPAKKTARQMIAMTMAINKDNFHGRTEVTCYTCHKGSEHPSSTPPVLESEAAPRNAAHPPAGNSGPTADEIIDKYIAAVGGADALRKVTTRIETGKIQAMGTESPIEVVTKAPDMRISIAKMGNGDSFTAFNGKIGWLGSTGRPAREMSPAETAAAAIDAAFNLPLQLKEMFPQLRRGRPEEINGVMCNVINASGPGKPLARFYFDSQTGLLVREVRFVENPLGRMPAQIDYSDYQTEDGVKIPLRWTLSRPNGRFTIQISEVKSNVPVEDSRFAMPTGEVK